MPRWQEFIFTVQYKSGRKNAGAVALSRCALRIPEDDTLLSYEDVLSLTCFSSSSFAAEQQRDPNACPLIRHLDGSDSSSDCGLIQPSKYFVLQNGVLFQKNYYSAEARSLSSVPDDLQGKCFRLYAMILQLIIWDFFKTYERVRRRYFYTKLHSFVYRHVTPCKECQRRKHPTSAPAGLLQLL